MLFKYSGKYVNIYFNKKITCIYAYICMCLYLYVFVYVGVCVSVCVYISFCLYFYIFHVVSRLFLCVPAVSLSSFIFLFL